MICPECGTQKTSVIKTMVVPGQCSRMRECTCGVRFFTVEKVTCRVAPATAGQPPRNHGQPPVTTGNPPATGGGVGGGLSSGSVSVSSLDPDSSPISKSVEVLSKTARARGPGIEYPAEWERFWATTTKYGSKEDAYKVWVKRGRFDVDALIAAWANWMKLPGWQDGYSCHVVKWLRGGCYAQEPSEPDRKANARPSANGSATGYGTVSKHTSTGQQEL